MNAKITAHTKTIRAHGLVIFIETRVTVYDEQELGKKDRE